VLGLQLIGDDEQLQDAIRRELERARQPAPKAGGGTDRRSPNVMADLEGQRRKLLRLYYDDRIGADLFAEEEARLAGAIKAAQREEEASQAEVVRSGDVERHFDDVARMLAALDVERTWAAATEVERRVLLDEFLECITVLPDYIDVNIHGAPPIHVLYQVVGLKESELIVSEGGARHNAMRAFDAYAAWGSPHVEARIGGDLVREVGATELWLPAA
jgi:hypothetical protein